MAQIYGYILGDICIKILHTTELCDKQVVHLKSHEFGEVLPKLEPFFPFTKLVLKS